MTTITRQDIKQRAIIILAICGAMTVTHMVNALTGGALSAFGIRPRELSGLYTIFTAPWLHSDMQHLGSNMAAMVVFLALILVDGPRYIAKASAIIIIVSGLAIWLLARDATHLGASGWIFGLWSLSIARGWYDRSYRNIAISLAVIVFYGGMVWGMLPTQAHISFEGHIFGALAGVLAARMLARPAPTATIAAAPSATLKFWP